MLSFFSDLIDVTDFPARWTCGTWTTQHGLVHIVSDLMIWMAYFALPCILVYFGWRRTDLPYRSLFWLFGAFIFACGTTHLMEAIIFYWPAYRLAGLVKVVTAAVSWGTVLALIPIVPAALMLRSPRELEAEIADRVAAEQRLRQSEERFRSLLDAAPDGMVIIDSSNRIALVNSELENLLGVPRSELLGRPVDDLFSPPTRALLLAYLQQRGSLLEAVQALVEDEPMIVRGDGTSFPAEFSVRALAAAGEPSLSLTVRDITERKRAATRLLQAERLAGIGQTVAGLAHEGRNALQRIQGCVEMLRITQPDQPNTLNLVDGIEKAQDRLHRLFEEVRGFVAPLNLRVAPTDVSTLWREAWDQLSVVRKERSARLDERSRTDDLTCSCDPFQIQQVFRNLLENSLSACDDPVVITVECEATELYGLPALSVTLRDNGPGFKEEQLERLFDAFYTTKTRGTGLGLAIAKRIIEAHHGRVAPRLRPEGGAEITITLPRTLAEPGA